MATIKEIYFEHNSPEAREWPVDKQCQCQSCKDFRGLDTRHSSIRFNRVRSITVNGFKSLADVKLNLESSGFTTLVGKNDSGKTSFFQALQIVYAQRSFRFPEEVCNRTPNAIANITLEIETVGNGKAIKAGIYDLTWMYRGSEAKWQLSGKPEYGTAHLANYGTPPHDLLPTLISVVNEPLPAVMSMKQAASGSPQAAFSSLFKFNADLPGRTRLSATNLAEQRIEQLFKQLWPGADVANFRCNAAGEQVTPCVCGTDIEYLATYERGAGLQRLLSIVVQIAAGSPSAPNGILVTIDEPEQSLHPGAQSEVLRGFSRFPPFLQLIYSTHSPAMIDLSRPLAIRTLLLDPKERVTHVHDREHVLDNYETVRKELGINQSHSLGSSGPKVVVEGAADLIVFEDWHRKLFEAGIVRLCPTQVTYVNGDGTTASIYYDVCRSSSEYVFTLLDNDNGGRTIEEALAPILQRYGDPTDRVILLRVGSTDTDLESLLTPEKLIAEVNRILNSDQPLTLPELVGSGAQKLSGKLGQEFKARGMNYNHIKKQVSATVGTAMTAAEIPSVFVDAIKLIESRVL